MNLKLADNLFDYDREETPGEVIFFKLFELFILYGVIRLAWDWGFYIPRISDVVLPLGLAHYLDISVMFGSWQGPANAAAITLAALLGFFRVGRFGWPVAALLLIWQYSTRFSLGEISHSSNLTGLTAVAFAVAHVAFDAPALRRRFALGFTIFFVGIGYTSAGFCKLIATGITWPSGPHLKLWVFEKMTDHLSKTGEWDLNFVQEIVLQHTWIGTIMLSIGLMSELGAFLMWWRRFRFFVASAVIMLHLGIFMILRIMFDLALYEVIFLAVPWANHIDGLLRQPGRAAALGPVQRFASRFA